MKDETKDNKQGSKTMKAEDIERAIAKLEPKDLADEELYREMLIAGLEVRKYPRFIEKLNKKCVELIEKAEKDYKEWPSRPRRLSEETNYGSGFFLDISDIDPFPYNKK